jgi:hypothetical protein
LAETLKNLLPEALLKILSDRILSRIVRRRRQNNLKREKTYRGVQVRHPTLDGGGKNHRHQISQRSRSPSGRAGLKPREGQIVEAERSGSGVIIGSRHHEDFVEMRCESPRRSNPPGKTRGYLCTKVVQPLSPNQVRDRQQTVLKIACLGMVSAQAATEKCDKRVTVIVPTTISLLGEILCTRMP